MQSRFYNCTRLTGAPVVNASPVSYAYAFYNIQITGISGTTTLKDNYMQLRMINKTI